MSLDEEVGELMRTIAAPSWKIWVSGAKRAAATDRVKNLLASNPGAYASILEAALRWGAADLAQYLVKPPGETRNWQATCAAMASPHAEIRREVASGLLDEELSSSQASELVAAVETGLRQGGSSEVPGKVCYLLYQLASRWLDFEAATSTPGFREAEQAAGRALARGDDPRAGFAVVYGAVPKAPANEKALELLDHISRGEFGASASAAMSQVAATTAQLRSYLQPQARPQPGADELGGVMKLLADKYLIGFSQEASVRVLLMHFWEPEAFARCGPHGREGSR